MRSITTWISAPRRAASARIRQQPAVPGLQPGPGDPVGARHRGAMLPGPLLFPEGPQVVVVLEQLQDHLPALLVDELFQLAGREPSPAAAGPASSPAGGWDRDQRWTLARVAALVTRLFGVSYTPRGVS